MIELTLYITNKVTCLDVNQNFTRCYILGVFSIINEPVFMQYQGMWIFKKFPFILKLFQMTSKFIDLYKFFVLFTDCFRLKVKAEITIIMTSLCDSGYIGAIAIGPELQSQNRHDARESHLTLMLHGIFCNFFREFTLKPFKCQFAVDLVSGTRIFHKRYHGGSFQSYHFVKNQNETNSFMELCIYYRLSLLTLAL